MKNKYFSYAALVLALAATAPTANAQSVLPKGLKGLTADAAAASAQQLQRTDTWGDWMGLAPSTPLPTATRVYYYNGQNQLTMESYGNYLAGDSETTVEVEKEGDIMPKEYIVYSYDERGNMVKAVKRVYGKYNGKYYGWKSASEVSESNSYDEQNRLTYQLKSTGRSHFTWEGKNLVEQVDSSNGGYRTHVIVYSNFLDGFDNLPQLVIDNAKGYAGTMSQGVYEYDGQGRPVTYTETKIKSAKEDANGYLTEIVLDTVPNKQTIWTYDENGLATEIASTWNKSKATYIPSTKTIQWLREDGGVEKSDSTWYSSKNAWYGGGSNTVDYTATYTTGTAPENFTVEAAEDTYGKINLTADAPADATESDIWKVYRNGQYQGRATLADGKITYTQEGISNGEWVYLIQRATETDTIGTNSTDAVTITATAPLNAPRYCKILSMTVTGTGYSKSCKTKISWTKPVAVEGIELQGYNVYVDITPTNTNPYAENTALITDTTYTCTWDCGTKTAHTVYVEAVYALGSAKADPLAALVGADSDRLLTTRSKLGNSMGTVSDETATNVETYYYDEQNRISRVITTKMVEGDNPQTPDVVETYGYYQPTTYKQYIYNSAGSLKEVRSAEYRVNQGTNMSWTAPTTIETYEYAADNVTLVKKTDESRAYEYVWDGKNLVTEKLISKSSGNTLSTVTYSDFLEGFDNLPQKGVRDGNYTSNQRIYEYAYDAAGNKISTLTYKFGEVQRDEDNNIVSVTNGTPEFKETWTFNEDGLRTQYLKEAWKNEAWESRTRTEYVQTNDGERETTYSYASYADKWTNGGTYVNVYRDYYKETTPTAFTVTVDPSKTNTVKITATAPKQMWGTPTYYIYRNGERVGEASYANKYTKTNLVFTDTDVPNGEWDYFIYTDMKMSNVATNITTPVCVTFATVVDTVTNVYQIDATNDGENYTLTVGWTAPKTNLTLKGYNVYSDIKSYTRNPVPDNGTTLVTDTTYTFTWSTEGSASKEVYVEAVYTIGRARSKMFPFDLSEVTAIGEAQADAPAALLSLEGRNLNVAGSYRTLTIFDASGKECGAYAGQPTVSLRALPQGVYVAKLITTDGKTGVCKFILK